MKWVFDHGTLDKRPGASFNQLNFVFYSVVASDQPEELAAIIEMAIVKPFHNPTWSVLIDFGRNDFEQLLFHRDR